MHALVVRRRRGPVAREHAGCLRRQPRGSVDGSIRRAREEWAWDERVGVRCMLQLQVVVWLQAL